jgi:hypothetical protein
MDPVAEHQADENHDDDETSPCPLFMNSLPKNFSGNPSLAALASLLDMDDDDDDDGGGCESIASPLVRDEDDSKKTTFDSSISLNRRHHEPRQGGGGKVRCPMSRTSRTRQSQPYPNTRDTRDACASKNSSKKEKGKPEATLGEAQLFLKLWKL